MQYQFNTAEWKQQTNRVSQLVIEGNHVGLKKHNGVYGVIIPIQEYQKYLELLKQTQDKVGK